MKVTYKTTREEIYEMVLSERFLTEKFKVPEKPRRSERDELMEKYLAERFGKTSSNGGCHTS